MSRESGLRFERLLRDLNELRRIGAQAEGGITRRAYSAEYGEAVRWLVERMAQAGLVARVDAVGNVIGRLGPVDGPAVVAGSHIDTVPSGGWLDGAYGVLAALECARAMGESGVALKRAFEVVAFVDEEGAYLSLLGSRAFVGELSASQLAAAKNAIGNPLHGAMQRLGMDPARYAEARRAPEELAAYVELHIEQGPVLEQTKTQIGIVEGIVGILVAHYDFSGSADHAGTTPMGMRRDALRCAAEFITAAYEALSERKPGDARFTFGAIEVLPGASNVVPRSARVTLEIRSLVTSTIENAFADLQCLAQQSSSRYGIELGVRRVSYNAPRTMAPEVMDAIDASCAATGASSLRMPSGAGHDAQSLAASCPAGMIFVPSRQGASHRPDEATDESDLALGAEILLRTIRKLTT